MTPEQKAFIRDRLLQERHRLVTGVMEMNVEGGPLPLLDDGAMRVVTKASGHEPMSKTAIKQAVKVLPRYQRAGLVRSAIPFSLWRSAVRAYRFMAVSGNGERNRLSKLYGIPFDKKKEFILGAILKKNSHNYKRSFDLTTRGDQAFIVNGYKHWADCNREAKSEKPIVLDVPCTIGKLTVKVLPNIYTINGVLHRCGCKSDV